jgi:predicted Rossmann fold flavoprotein
VPLKTGFRFNARLKGLKINAVAAVEVDGSLLTQDKGEILFTEYGLSGPPIIQMSRFANSAMNDKRQTAINIDLFPDWSIDEISKEIDSRFSRIPESSAEDALIGLLHKRLIPVVISEAGILQVNKKCVDVTAGEKKQLALILKEWKIPLTGSLSWNDAQVMAGGINTSDFNPATLESNIVPGLWAAGEVLDVTGDCGGYNLQWAWSSGYLAGLEASGNV